MGPRFTVQTGQFKTPVDLIAALDRAELAYFDPNVRELLLGLELCQDEDRVGAYEVTPYKVGNERHPLFGDFFDTQLPNLGFSRPVREYGALLILELDRQLLETGDCELKVGEYFLVLTDPLAVSDLGRQCFLYVRRRQDGLRLSYEGFYPDSDVRLDDSCLSTRK